MNIQDIAKLIEKAGGKLYLVGGTIRDELLGKEGFDEDYCVTGLSKEKFEKLFPNAISRGKDFEVYDLENKEFALARKDIKEGIGHKGFRIITGSEITIEEDLKRRDITINSIARNVLTNEIVDPFNGQEDIKQKVIRANSESFLEDPLRVYRVARIASNLGFEVEKNTLKLMGSLKEELNTLSKERVFTELRKALETDKPSVFFDTLKEAKVLDVHFKEIYDLIGSEQPAKYHPEGDSYNHTMITLDNSCVLTNDSAIRFAALVHDLGKGITPKDMRPHHYGHDEAGINLVRQLGNRVSVPKSWIKIGITSCKEHMKAGIFFKMSIKKRVSFVERVSESLLGLEGLQMIVYADRCRQRGRNIVNEEYNFKDIGEKMIEEIDGKFIKQKYKNIIGKAFKNKLHEERVAWMKERYCN